MQERWEATEECERYFRGTSLRYSSGNIGLAWLPGDVELIRIGTALRPEIASWRYGRVLSRRRPLRDQVTFRAARLASHLMSHVLPMRSRAPRDARAIASRFAAMLHGNRVLDLVPVHDGTTGGALDPTWHDHDGPCNDAPVAVVRYRHLLDAALVRPESGRPWSLRIPHDHGVLAVAGDRGVQLAGRLLSVINGSERGGGFSRDMLEAAVAKVGDSAQPDSYFNRVLAIAMRTRWGRDGERRTLDETANITMIERDPSQTERLALALTGRTFWGNGGIGSEPATALLDVPLVDRLALEMAAHEESERQALDGELAALTAAWREAAEIAAIADALIPTS